MQHYDLENLIEELCLRLKLSKKQENDSGNLSNNLQGSEESGNDTDDSSPEELAQKYV